MQSKVGKFGRLQGQKLGELALLEQIRARVVAAGPSAGLRLGIGDDCALLRVRAGEEVAVTTDLSIAGRHFRLEWHAAEAVGHRTLARGLSDLAAMGARPLGAFLSLGLPGELADTRSAKKAAGAGSWVSRFYDGFLALADRLKTPLAGGDLAESPLALADVVLVGAVPRGRALLRAGAQPGHLLYVTGALGGSAAGLATMAKLAGDRPSSGPLNIPESLLPQLTPHLYPEPRLAQGLWLQRRRVASAAIDLSDGLSTDLAHLCQESNVAAEVFADQIPLFPAATLEQALHGGEDYELLFTAAPETRLPAAIAGVPVTCIGRMVRRSKIRPQVTLVSATARQPLEPQGWQHFS